MRQYFTLTSLMFYLSVIALVGICMTTDRFINSTQKIVIYASSGEQEKVQVIVTPTETQARTVGEQEVAFTRKVIPTLTPTVSINVQRSGNFSVPAETVGVSELDIKRQICDVFKHDCDRALEVARAESNFNPNAKNSGSTATGIFQIIRGTFEAYHCSGERTNSLDNIRCAYKIYLRNGRKFNTTGGWAASFHAHGQD